MSQTPDMITVSGAPEGFDARILVDEMRRKGTPVIHVARDDKRLAATREALGFFAPDITVLDFPAWDCLPYDRVSPNSDIAAARMATLAGLAAGGTRTIHPVDHAGGGHAAGSGA